MFDAQHASRVRVGIVGGGASGTLVAALLLRDSTVPVEVVVFEPRAALGEGVAYSTTDERHLLNVPARGMSAFVDDPDHFRAWAGVEPAAFVPRRRYADYLRSVLADALTRAVPGSELTHVHERVTNLGFTPTPWAVTENDAYVAVDHLVLALGNDAPPVPEVLTAGLPSSRLVCDPWAPDALDVVQPGERVLLVGTGLTAIDVAISLCSNVRGVRVDAVSRHGLLPAAHTTAWQPAPAAPDWDLERTTPRDVLRYVRGFGADWRSAMDSLRPVTARLWQAWDNRTREEAVTRLGRFWDVHRHRMAPGIAVVVDRLTRSGRLTLHRASLQSAINTAHGVDVLLSCGAWLQADRIVVCTGPTGRADRDPLGRLLLARGQAQAGPLGLGLQVDPLDGHLLDTDGEPVPQVTTIGPLRRGMLWESTAMPEIRVQAAGIVRALLSDRVAVGV
jgi:uncharacterized NAD(P)/FAD-binding protein YdhS